MQDQQLPLATRITPADELQEVQYVVDMQLRQSGMYSAQIMQIRVAEVGAI